MKTSFDDYCLGTAWTLSRTWKGWWHLQLRHRLAWCCKASVENGWWQRSKVEPRACIACEALKKEFTKGGHLSSHHTLGIWSFWASSMQHKQDKPHQRARGWLACHAPRGKSLTTSAIPHIQELWIRASETASLTSSFQSMPLLTVSFFYIWVHRLFSIFNWLQKLELMICLSAQDSMATPSCFIFEKLFLLLCSSVMDHTHCTEEIIFD